MNTLVTPSIKKLSQIAGAAIVACIIALLFFALPAHALNPPTISPATGSFQTQQTVTMTASSGAIYFTVDGSQPTTSSTLYSGAITIASSTQINAVAYLSGVYSAVTTVYLDVDPRLALIIPFYTTSTNPLATEILTVGLDSHNNTTITVSGAPGTGDGLSINTYVGGLPQGRDTINYTVPFGSSLSSIAAALASAINSDTNLQSAGISATSSGAVVTISDALIIRVRSSFAVGNDIGAPPPVSLWSDLSGAANNFSGASASQPVLLQSPTGSAVDFNGTSQYLSLPSGFSTFNDMSAFMVTRPNSLTAGARMLDIGSGASGNNVLLQIAASGSTGQLGIYIGTTGAFATSASALTSGQYQLIEAVVLSTGATVYVNGQAGTTNASLTSIPSATRTSNFLGQASSTGSYYPGDISELMLFNAGLGSSREAQIRAYLIQKYQLMSQVPPTPIISVAGSTLSGPTQVVISAPPDATVRITLDGTTPTSTSPLYLGCPLTINYSQTLKAIAIKNGVQSGVASAIYTLDSTQWPAPSPSDVTAPTINLQLPTASQ